MYGYRDDMRATNGAYCPSFIRRILHIIYLTYSLRRIIWIVNLVIVALEYILHTFVVYDKYASGADGTQNIFPKMTLNFNHGLPKQ